MHEEGERRAAERDERTVQYLPLVHHLVTRIAARIPRHVHRDDLVSAGMIGLVDAARTFDETRGVPFESFAATRIRGALLDELRSLDWASRSVRTRARAYDERVVALTAKLGRAPSAVELADAMGIEPAAVQRIVNDVHRATVVPLEAIAVAGDLVQGLATEAKLPDQLLLDRERRGYLRAAIGALPERMRVVVEGYFFEERLMQDIADELGVTESRVSQIRSEALTLLRDAMEIQLEPELATAQPSVGRPSRKRAAYLAAVTSAGPRSTSSRHAPCGTVVPLRQAVAG